MSSAFYPQGMNSYNNRLPQGGYESWKGTGIHSNPVGVTAGNIRPFTNKDYLNAAPGPFGKPRPMKHYRRGISVYSKIPVLVVNPENPYEIIEMDYNSNREVKSSVQDRMIQQMIDNPGRYSIKENTIDSTGNPYKCGDCKGVGIVSDWQPINDLTEKPEPNVTNPVLCCNQEKKAKQRVIYASTNLKKNYYTTTNEYLYNRCQTYDQRVFNFQTGVETGNGNVPYNTPAKPGSALATTNLYVANCNPNGLIDQAGVTATVTRLAEVLYQRGIISEPDYNNFKTLAITTLEEFRAYIQSLPTEQKVQAIALIDEIVSNPYSGAILSGPSNPKGCKRVYYKPNNPQFAQQGGVSSSTRTLKLNVTTIEKNAYLNKRQNTLKQKAPVCDPATYIGNPFFFQGQHQNKHICSKPVKIYNTYVTLNQKSAGNYIGATQP